MNIRWNQSRSSVCVFTKKKMAAHMSCIIAGNKVKKKVSTVYRRIIHCNIYKNFFFFTTGYCVDFGVCQQWKYWPQ